MDKSILDKLFPAEILALTIYGEARGEPIEGQIAVGNVIINRFKQDSYKTITSVCLKPKQFSCWNDSDPNLPELLKLANQLVNNSVPQNRVWIQCLAIADILINNRLLDNTSNSKYYMTTELFNSNKRPTWSKNPKNAKIIGNHTFFNV